MLTLLLVSTLTLTFNIQQVRANGTIYIKADGSVDPEAAPISSVDNVTYTFTDNIYDSIVVERDNIVVDGAGYTLQGTGATNSKGIYLSGRSNVTIKKMEIKTYDYGIFLDGSFNNTISGNNITNNWIGIRLTKSTSNSISGNIITQSFQYGIWIHAYSSDNKISANIITATDRHGIGVTNSFNNSISGNNITANNIDGIFIYYSSNNGISENIITANNENGIEIDYKSYNNTVSENIITANNWNGILLKYYSSHNMISSNTILNNRNGIRIEDNSNHNHMLNNYIADCEWDGIDLMGSQNNSVIGNTLNKCFTGIYMGHKNDNMNVIYHNNFLDNTYQVTCYSTPNMWDDDYPSGGNYWSDYSGTDLYSGPYQNETGSDGIGDTAYIIDESNQDNYPFMEPWSAPAERKVGVKVGDWTLYQVNYTYSTNDPEPPLPRPPSEVFEIEQFRFFVQHVHETNVTFRFTTYYKDGIEETIERFIDVNTGEGIPVFLIGANLTADDIIYPDHWSEIRINETIPRRYLDVIRETNHYCIEASVHHDSYEENSSIHIYWDRATGFLTESMFETIVMDKTRNYTTYYLSSLQIIATNLWSPKPPSPVEATQELIEIIETWNLSKGTENSLKAKLKVAIHMLDMGKEDEAIRKLTAFINRVEMLREKTLTNEQADYLATEAQRIKNYLFLGSYLLLTLDAYILHSFTFSESSVVVFGLFAKFKSRRLMHI